MSSWLSMLEPAKVEVKGATVVHKLDNETPKNRVTFNEAIAIERARLERNEKRRLSSGTEARRERIIAVLRRFRDAQIEWTSAYSIARSTGLDVASVTNLLVSMREDCIVRSTPKKNRLYGSPQNQNSMGFGWMIND